MKTKQQLVRLWKRPSKDGKSYTYYLRFYTADNKPAIQSLGHADGRKAEKQRLAKEKELRMGFCPPGAMRLSEFCKNCLDRSGDNLRESSKVEYRTGMKQLIKVIGNIDIRAISHSHGEKFRQACLDSGNRPHTIAKKIRQLKSMFQLGVNRNQLDENPFKNLKPPKTPTKTIIRTYTPEQCDRLIKEASGYQQDWLLEWDLVITVALTTGMRKSEILNTVWSDIDFKNMTITISPKQNTEYTWAWEVKDTDSRTLPLTEDVTKLLINLQGRRPEGYPYVFVSPTRFDRIQLARRNQSNKKKKNWSIQDANNSIVNNFTDVFNVIRSRAGIEKGTFHDLRRTAITNWFYEGLEIIEVMRLAGHSKYDTTLKYYLSVKDNLIDKARRAVMHRVSREMMDRCLEK